MFTIYPEKVLKEACNPIHGIPGYHEFFPSLAKLRSFLEDVAARQLRHSRPAIPLQDINEYLPETAPVAFYEGPIEEVRPGDKLHISRMDEYESFIRTKGVVPRRWGYNENWVDSGARPFVLSTKPIGESISPELTQSPPVPSQEEASSNPPSQAEGL